MFCSIIVPTYNTDPERLDALVASVDAQTLSTTDFELIFVDDGSTTDIVSRLHAIAAERSNMSVIELENSGWACRPRNQGTLAARGEWVLYMDHDDLIYPEALARLKSFTSGIEADVVNPKEVRTRLWSWGWDQFVSDRADAQVDAGPLAFLPMTPHKLYRRAFLIENDITFIEERRVLWEDVFFNVLAYSRGARVAIFSSYPVYHWVQTGENTSSTFGRNRDEFWGGIRRLLEFFAATLSDQADIDRLAVHWLRTRVLSFARAVEERPDVEAVDFVHARNIMRDLIPERLDEKLDPLNRRLAALMRADDETSAHALAVEIGEYETRTTGSAFAWDGDTLTFAVDTRFTTGDRPLVLDRAGDSLLLPVPGGTVDLAGGFATAETHLSVRGVTSRESTPLSAAAAVVVDGSGEPRTQFTARVGVAELVSNRAMPAQRWDVAARVTLPGHTTHRAIRIPDETFQSAHAIVNGRQVAALRGKEAQLTIAVDTDAASVVSLLERDEAPTVTRTRGSKTTFAVAVPAVPTVGEVALECEIAVTPVGDDGTTQVGPRLLLPARLELGSENFTVRSEPSLVPRGRFRVTVSVGTAKRRIGLATVEKNAVQRLAGYVAARRAG